MWMQKNGMDKKYQSNGFSAEYLSEEWYLGIHGGRLLTDMFNDLSESRVSYDKVRHGLMLTRRLVELSNGALTQLAVTLG